MKTLIGTLIVMATLVGCVSSAPAPVVGRSPVNSHGSYFAPRSEPVSNGSGNTFLSTGK